MTFSVNHPHVWAYRCGVLTCDRRLGNSSVDAGGLEDSSLHRSCRLVYPRLRFSCITYLNLSAPTLSTPGRGRTHFLGSFDIGRAPPHAMTSLVLAGKRIVRPHIRHFPFLTVIMQPS